MKSFYIFIFISLLSACVNKKSNPFCDDINTIVSNGNDKLQKGSLIIKGDTMPHINDIICVGDLLIVDVNDKDGRMQVFTQDGDRLGKSARFGRAENEYTKGMSFVGQPHDNQLYLRDVNKACFVVLETDSFRYNCNLTSKRIIKTYPRVLNIFLSGDSTLIYEHEVTGSYALAAKNIDDGTEQWQEVLYDPTDDPFYKYHSYMVYNDKKNMLVGAMRFMNQINFFDTASKQRKSFTMDSTQKSGSEEDGNEYYCNIKANDKNIYALYMNQSPDEAYQVEKPMEIHVFDWDGNFIDKIVVKDYIIRIAVDRDGTLYGKDLDGNIIKY